MELFDNIAPVTVNNFLNYVRSGRYNGTVVHRSEPGFVIQGGWLRFDEAAFNFVTVNTDPNIANEFMLSNTRGTLAMAKVGGDPNSANSQWFINLANNSFLDSDNGGFTVFGRVMENGMAVVDAIAQLPRAIIAANSPFPVINFNGVTLTNSNLVNVSMAVLAPNYFDNATGTLRVTVDAGTAGKAALSFSVVSTAPAVVIQLNLASVVALTQSVDKIATFDLNTGRLLLPELVVNGAVAFRNVRFRLSDANLLLFTLESFE